MELTVGLIVGPVIDLVIDVIGVISVTRRLLQQLVQPADIIVIIECLQSNRSQQCQLLAYDNMAAGK